MKEPTVPDTVFSALSIGRRFSHFTSTQRRKNGSDPTDVEPMLMHHYQVRRRSFRESGYSRRDLGEFRQGRHTNLL